MSHSPANAANDGDALFDLALVGHLLGFARRSVRRHRRLAVLAFLGITGAALAALVLMPRTYYTQAKLLAQRNVVIPTLGNPRRAVPSESDAPTRLATEAILRRQSLEAIVQQTNLLQKWKEQRAPIVRLKDAAKRAIGGPMTPAEELDAMVGLLTDRLRVETREGTVTISIRWPNAQTAYHIVQVAQDNFLADRHTTEVSLIGESIAILEGQVAQTRLVIDSAFTELQGVLPPRVAPLPVRRDRPRVSQELASLQARLASKRQTISDLLAFHTRRVAEVQTRLAEQQNRFGANHPEIANTRQALAALGNEPPQLESLRREERDLVADVTRLGGTPGVTNATPAVGPSEDLVAAARRLQPDSAMSAEESYARSQLRIALGNYQDHIDRLNDARIELETARAAFKYRYSVLTPVQVPKNPVRPKPLLVLAAGLILGTGLALGAPILLDLMRGRLLEPWQVRTSVGLDVLGEVRSA